MRQDFDVVAEYLGDGTLDTYSFDFKVVDASQVNAKIYDTNNTLVSSFTCDDTASFTSFTFNSQNGGGSLQLLSNLANGYRLLLILADDQPVQIYQLRDMGDFVLRNIENAFDRIVGALQRAAYLVQRSVKLDDGDDPDFFDPTLPINTPNQPKALLGQNLDGNGFGWYDPTTVALNGGPFTISNGMIVTAVTDMRFLSSVSSSVEFIVEIQRAGGIYLHQRISIINTDIGWQVYENSLNGRGAASGLDWTVVTDGLYQQIQVADNNASGAGTIKWKGSYFNA